MAYIDDTALRIATRSGFLKEFWLRRKADPRLPTLDIYTELSDLYAKTFGETLFPSYEAFCKVKNRH